MATNWHPSEGFDALILCLFTDAAFASSWNVDIGLCIIKQCSMNSKEYKAWIVLGAIHPHIIGMFDKFKTFLAAKITLINSSTKPQSPPASTDTGWTPSMKMVKMVHPSYPRVS